jgi:HAD superfamily hydrolase (TIGR01509 family)
MLRKKIKLIISDLDGVLVDTRDIHFNVLNKALAEIDEKYVISYKDHLSKFDGLSTNKKLELLTKEKELPIDLYKTIWQRKQELTVNELENQIEPSEKIINIIKELKNKNIKFYVASNSIKKTVEICLKKLGIYDLVDGFLSNEDVLSPKPHPEIFMRCMINEKVLPQNTLILEDSYVGRSAAIASGANLCPINKIEDLNIEKIKTYMDQESKEFKWTNEKLNILIPMAGAGSRFSSVGYTFPKPLIEVNGKPMIQLVIDNLNVNANFIYVVRKEHYEKYNLQSLLNAITPNCKIIIVDELTEGACCTTLLAEKFIDNDNPLLIANSDQFMDWNSGEYYHSLNTKGIDGSIIIFENNHPKWSYVKCDEYGNVLELKEKEVISNNATVGVYFWNKGSDYVKYSKQMILKNIRVNNEFYVAPVYNEAILDGKIIKTYKINKMWGLGTPEDLNVFLQNYNS